MWGGGGGVVKNEPRRSSVEMCIIRSAGTCNAEACVANGGRCKFRPGGAQQCKPDVFEHANEALLRSDMWLRSWVNKHARGKCTGCKCTAYPGDVKTRVKKRAKGNS